MKELCGLEVILIIALRFAIKEGMKFSYDGQEVYNPRDFSYWGA